MNTFEMAEDALLEFCRWERLADKATRHHLALIDAGILPTEANQIMADVAADLLRNIDAEPLEESA